MIKPKHLLHPVRIARIATARLSAHINMKRFASTSERRFRGDCRYNLEAVSEGFKPRPDDSVDDAPLLERICRAYNKAVTDSRNASVHYEATKWWEALRQRPLKPVLDALRSCDVPTLSGMYRNFFRDPCSTGLIGVPYGMLRVYLSRRLKDVYRHSYMGDALYRLDYWESEMGGHFVLNDLAGPEIGNPFGVSIDGTLVRPAAEFQHYCAQKILGQLDSGPRAVVEIGGGYGGMAYYLIRDRSDTTYIDFDLPESLAIASYYLMKAFPSSTFMLYGEGDFTAQSRTANIVLMPVFAMGKVRSGSVDATFSAHAVSDLPRDALQEYIGHVLRMTKQWFTFIGNAEGASQISSLLRERSDFVQLIETRPIGWNAHRTSSPEEIECLYRLDTQATSLKEPLDPRNRGF